MSHTSVPQKTKLRLWVRAGGRCQYRGCNDPLWVDSLTMREMNKAYVAHIVADSANGPRGDPVRSPLLEADIANLMLLCDAHHTTIDETDVPGHPESLLVEMKREHEERIERVTSIGADLKSHVLLYGANIGDHSSPLGQRQVEDAVLQGRYPAAHILALETIDSHGRDRDASYWLSEQENLVGKFKDRVRPLVARGEVRHVSVFALAPQPLLVLLGTLLTDIIPADVRQLRRNPKGWRWPDPAPPAPDLQLAAPTTVAGPPALIVSLSATITDDRVAAVMPDGFTPWRVSLPSPFHDCIGAPEHRNAFADLIKKVFDQIKRAHGDETLHIFPAAPVSTMVEFGRARQSKADMRWQIYDENDGFKPAITIERGCG